MARNLKLRLIQPCNRAAGCQNISDYAQRWESLSEGDKLKKALALGATAGRSMKKFEG